MRYPKVVGWDSGPRTDTELVLSALDNAVLSRDIRDGQLIHHSDNGCQYTSVRFTQRLVDAGIARSTRGRRGQLRQRPGREPVVDYQDRAYLLARKHFATPLRPPSQLRAFGMVSTIAAACGEASPTITRAGELVTHDTSEASLGPPRWAAGLGAIVAICGWVRSGPSLPSDNRGAAARLGGGQDRLGRPGLRHGYDGDCQRCARWACGARCGVPGSDLPQRLRAQSADGRAGRLVFDPASGQPDSIAGDPGEDRQRIPPRGCRRSPRTTTFRWCASPRPTARSTSCGRT
jgi:hypothetical protein